MVNEMKEHVIETSIEDRDGNVMNIKSEPMEGVTITGTLRIGCLNDIGLLKETIRKSLLGCL